MSNDLTPEELAWVTRNPEAVRTAMKAAKSGRETRVLPDDPVDRSVALLTASIAKQLRAIDRKAVEIRERIADYQEMARSVRPETASLGTARLEEHREEYAETLMACERHVAALKGKIERMERDPESCFLPIGAIVRFVGVPSYSDSTSLTDTRKDYPVAGSVGVVSRLNGRNEYFLGVTMRREFSVGWKDTITPTYERMVTYTVDPDMLEVVGYANLPDGSEYHGYGYVETHEREDEDEERQEMVLEADGFFWRFHDFGGEQGMEVLQAYEDIAEMSWLGEPLPRFRQTVDTAPKGP